jgi:hypothetical protein
VTVLNRRRTLDLTIAGAPIGSFATVTQTIPVHLGDVILHTFTVRIPSGHAGLTGVALLNNGVTICPFDNPAPPFIIGNDSLFEYSIETEVDSGLAVTQFNKDTLAHTHYLQFSFTPISAAPKAPATAAMVPIG